MSEEKEKRDFVEEIEVTGSELVDRVKELVEAGNVRRLIIRKSDGDILLEIPLTAGAAIAGGLTLWNPLLAGLGAMAALVAKLKIEIVRVDEDADIVDTDEPASRISVNVDDE